MAKYIIMTPEQEQEWNAWVQARPASVQALIALLPFDRLYRIKSSGHRGTIYSYEEDGTVTLNVTGEYNFVAFDRRVFGISPDNLEECDFPVPNEPRGSIL